MGMEMMMIIRVVTVDRQGYSKYHRVVLLSTFFPSPSSSSSSSSGVLIYEVFTGKKPFKDMTAREVLFFGDACVEDDRPQWLFICTRILMGMFISGREIRGKRRTSSNTVIIDEFTGI